MGIMIRPPKVHAEQTIHVNNEHSAKKDPVTTFNKFRTLQEEEEEPLEVHLNPFKTKKRRMTNWPIPTLHVYHQKLSQGLGIPK